MQLSLLTDSDDESEEGRKKAAPRSIEDIPFREVSTLPRFEDIADGDLFSISLSNNTTGLTHGLHRFPAKFIPQIPRWALRELAAPGDRVVDPFAGSGTTLVECLLHDVDALGLDVDPLARLIARAKTGMPDAKRMSHLGSVLRDGWDGPAEDLECPMPDVDNFDHWFTEDAWAKLQALLHGIRSLECSGQERDFLLAVFSSILRRVSNADDQSQKTYVSGTRPKDPPDALDTFWRSYNDAVAALKRLETGAAQEASVEVAEAGDALDMSLSPETVDLMITSPPYLDSVDYMYNFMLEYFWLGPLLGIPDRKSFNTYKKRFVGAKRPTEKTEEVPEPLRGLLDPSIFSRRRLIAANRYFEKMRAHFEEAAQRLREGGRYVIVVGNSRTKKGIIPLHECLLRLAEQAGLKLEKSFGYRIRRHYMKFPRKGRGGIILIDWVLVLRKTSGPAGEAQRLPLPWATLGEDQVAH